jgi:hypothetical protein
MTTEAPAIRIMRSFIEDASEGSPELRRLLEISLLRVAINAARRPTESFTDNRPAFAQDHIVDWLKAALVNDAPWLLKLDADGRPKKLMKFGSLADMMREADRDMLRWSTQVTRGDLPANSEVIVASLEGGYTIVRMLTPEALDAESAEMQHCVGQGAYDRCLHDGKTLLLSLRDKAGKAHATIEVCAGLVEQVEGKQNKPPKLKYIKLIADYFRQTDFNWTLFGNGSEGFVIDIHGEIHSCDDLPDELHAQGALVLRSGAKMPMVATATTDITVYCRSGARAPVRLEAGRDIALVGPGFTTCPELVLQGGLALDHTDINTLAAGLSVGSLDVRNTPLTSIPDDFRCKGSLALKYTKMTALPASLWKIERDKVCSYGTVDLLGSPVSDLGGLCHVNGSLALTSTSMTKIPSDFSVSGTLDVGHLGRIVIGERVNATQLNAAMTSIVFLGDVLNLGEIHLTGCGVSFPPVVKSSHSVTLIRCTIDKMPKRMECLGKFDLSRSRSDGFPAFIRAKQLWIADMRNTKWTDFMTVLEGDIEAEEIVLRDGHLSIGDRVKAAKVSIFPDSSRYAQMSVTDARTYLRQHSDGQLDAVDRVVDLDQFAKKDGVEFKYYTDFLPGGIEHANKKGFIFGFGDSR